VLATAECHSVTRHVGTAEKLSRGKIGARTRFEGMTKTLLAASLLSALASCTTGADDPSPTTQPDMTVAASFKSKTGTTIEVIPIGASGYLATELGDASLPRALPTSQVPTPLELYQQIAASPTSPPPALVELSSRVSSTNITRTSPPVAARPVTPDANQCTATNFEAKGYCLSGAQDTWCLLDWHNGAYSYNSDTWYSLAYLCATTGPIVWKITNGDGGDHSYTVLAGQLFDYYLYDSDGTWLDYNVTQASGDEFQFGGEDYE
jgi:hypothetical protein